MANYSHTIISLLLMLCFFLVAVQAQFNDDSSFRGGHFSWRPSTKTNTILVDYHVFFDLSGDEARQCTEDAIKRQQTINTGFGIYVWDENPYTSDRPPRQVGRINFVCKLHDKDFMKRVVGEFEGFQYEAHRFKFYIGALDSVINKPIFTYVDLTKRKDTNDINQSPRVTIFPYYQVDGGNTRISVHAVDEDNDYIKCTDMASKNVIANCDMTIPAMLPNGYYQGWILVEDLMHRESKESFSQVIVQFDVQKMEARPSRLRPRLSIPLSRTCVYLKDFNGEWKSNVFASLTSSELKAMDPQILGPSGTTATVSDSGTNRKRISLRWQPKDQTKRKHMFCFVFAGVERKEPSKTHVSQVKCYYLNYGEKTLEYETLNPRNGSVVDPLVDRFELRVHGAFLKSPDWSRNYLAVRNLDDDKLEYFFDIHDEGTYTRTQDNRITLTSNKIKFLKPGNYYVTSSRALYNPEAQCMQSEVIRKGDWVFSVTKDSSETTTTTTRSTSTMKSTTHAITHQVKTSNKTPIVAKEDMKKSESTTTTTRKTSSTIQSTPSTTLSTMRPTTVKHAEESGSSVFTKLSQGNLVNVIPFWSRAWRVSFYIKPDPSIVGYRSIFHFTTGKFCCELGTRVPVVFQVPGKNRLMVNNHNYRYIIDDLPADRFTQITIEQVKSSQNNGDYTYRILVDGKQVYTVDNQNAKEFRDVKVYAGNPWYKPADAQIKDFKYESLETAHDSTDMMKSTSTTTTTRKTTSTTRSSTTIRPTTMKHAEESDSSVYTKLSKGNLVNVIPFWSRGWRVSFSVKPDPTTKEFQNIFHFTTGEFCCERGTRIPVVFQVPGENKITIMTFVNENNNYRYDTEELPANQFSQIVIEQVESSRTRGSYTYRIMVNGKQVHTVENSAAQEFRDVKVYAGNPWYTPADVQIKDFNYESLEKHNQSVDLMKSASVTTTTRKTSTTARSTTPSTTSTVRPKRQQPGALDSSQEMNLFRGNLMGIIPTWKKSWRVSFSIKPYRIATNSKNVFQFTTGMICCDKGTRIPAIYQIPYEDRLSIVSAVNQDNNYRFDTDVLPENEFTDIVIEQIKSSQFRDTYTYRILVNGRVVHSVENDEAEEFYNVKVYGGNPWQSAADVRVKDFKYENLDALSHSSSHSSMGSSGTEMRPATTRPRTMMRHRGTDTTTTTTRDNRMIDFNRFFDNKEEAAAVDNNNKIQHNSKLECFENRMEFFFQPKNGEKIEDVTLSYDWCKMKFSRERNGYMMTTAYDQCGTMMKENDDYIIFKNVARVYYLDEAAQHSMIERKSVFNIGLECQMNKNSIHTMKAKGEDSVGMVTNPQTVQYHDYAKGFGSFRVDFQVYKSAKYNYSYGTEEFPIYLGMSDRIFFELSMDRKDMNLIPHACYATKNNDHKEFPRYHIIKDRCPKDATYKQHSKSYGNIFQFSIHAFTMKGAGDSFYVHCHSYVCKNTEDERCQFGCNNGLNLPRRARRDIQVTETVVKEGESIMTSTLEIRIKDNKIDRVEIIKTASNDTKEAKESFTKYIYYLQIPIALIVIGGIYLTWRCLRQSGQEDVQEEIKK